MYQVRPAHPIQTKAIWDYEESITSTPMSAQQSYPSNVQLPRKLQRPQYIEVPAQNIAAVDPELSQVPVDYVRRGLKNQANQMFAGIAALQLPQSMHRSQLHHTPSLTVPIRPSGPSSSYPTHILALSKSSTSESYVTLVPTHALILASNCAALPRLPPSASSHGATASVTLPVLPLTIPAPAAFTPLHTFLYTHSAPNSSPLSFQPSRALSSLRGTLASGPALHTLSAHLVSSAPGMGALTNVAQNIAAVWRNAVALGIHDPELWNCLDLAWEVILGAMNIGAGAR
ncbi:hypothetical protein BDR07DRAFT_1423553 [Suillus spraguei]|nr:hypothetical protein BDR07DRAFT_1423553 [Suillus spraguei]